MRTRPTERPRRSTPLLVLAAVGMAAALAESAVAADDAAREAGSPAAVDVQAPYLEAWAGILEQYTHPVPGTVGTAVDYRGLREGSGARAWQDLLDRLAGAPAPDHPDAELALWIDAYNILAIDTVLRAWPVDSIRDAGNLLWPVWRREAGTVAGRTVSLHEIEHEILRPMGEPRIHAAIVCASTSCPSLRRTPYRADEIDAQLDEQMRVWLANDTKGLRVDREADRITASRIFDWFGDDFDAIGGVRATLARYAPPPAREWLSANAAGSDLEYFDYDWTLNDWKRARAASTLSAR